MTLKFTLFGSPRFQLDDDALKLNERKAIALLVYLVLTDEPHSRERLAALFWPEAEPGRARANLRYVLWTLRKAIGKQWIGTRGESIFFDPSDETTVDVSQFRKQIEAWRSHQHENHLCADCVSGLSRAAEIYRGDLLAGLTLDDAPAFDEWHFFEAESLRRELLDTLDALTAHHSEKEEVEIAIEHARRRLALDPLHEPAHRTLMRLYAAAGQSAAALRQYEACVALLEEDLGVSPDEETKQLARAIRRRELPATQDVKTEPAALPEPANPHSLPQPANPFVGRRAELARIEEMLSTVACRLITIVGPGGIGKSRLALEAAHSVGSDFTDGAHWIPLVGVDSVELLPMTFMQNLGREVSGVSSSRIELFNYLASKQMLLVLDNFEQLVRAAPLLGDLLSQAPGIKFLVTSRHRLDLQGEWLLPLAGLDRGDESSAASDARTLLVQCAQRIRPDFQLAQNEVELADRICRQVDGMPLAIEQLASWLRATSLYEIADELAHSMAFLSTTMRDIPERHHSMKAVLDGSWQRLNPEQQAVLRRLSLFRGSCDREAAQAVAKSDLPMLAGLIDRSWLSVDGLGRYQIHELTQQYCAEQLADEHEIVSGESVDQVRRRFVEYFAGLLAPQPDELVTVFGTGQEFELLEPIRRDYQNVLQAWQWALDQGDGISIGRLVGRLSDFGGNFRGDYQATFDLLQKAVHTLGWSAEDQLATAEMDGAERLVLAHFLLRMAYLICVIGDMEKTKHLFNSGSDLLAGLSEAEKESAIVDSYLTTQAYILLSLGRYEDGKRLGRSQEEKGGGELPAKILFGLQLCARMSGDWQEAEAYLERWEETTGGPLYSAQIEQACCLGRREDAQRYIEETDIWRQKGIEQGWSTDFDLGSLVYRINRGKVSLLMDDLDKARCWFEEGLEIGNVSRNSMGRIRSLNGLGTVALLEEEWSLALERFRKEREIAVKAGRWRFVGMARLGMCRAEMGLGRLEAASAHLAEALDVLTKTDALPIKLDAVVAAAELAMAQGHTDDVIEKCSTVLKHPGALWETHERARRLLQQCDVAPPKAATPSGEYFDIEPLLGRIQRRNEAHGPG